MLGLHHRTRHHPLCRKEGVTRGMSLQGSQTGNTSGCCQYAFMTLSKCACEHIDSKLMSMGGQQSEEEVNRVIIKLNRIFFFLTYELSMALK